MEIPEASCRGHEMAIQRARRLPAELLIAIADHLDSHRDIVAFGLTCKSLYALLLKARKRSLEIGFDGSRAPGTVLSTSPYRLLSRWAVLLTTTGDDLGLEYAPNGSRSCGCKIGICSRDECELVRSFKELTLSGYLPYLEDVVYPLFIHPIMRSCGFRAMRPEVFKVNLNWDHWDFAVLDSISVTNLRILKLPINRRSDCIGLGQMLTAMPRLASLTITDIPDRDEFVNSLEHLGKGILSCASTLRELDIEMTNFNRPAPWDRDERFLEPEEDGFFFRKLFPCSLGDEHSALCERRLRNTTDTMAAASLSLTKLRVKHMSLPWYSFGVIFNAKTIKQLHLPYSMVDEQVWGLLEMYAQLYILTEVSYDMLSAGFLNFLKQQSMLKELTFASPQDQYEGWGFTLYGDSTYLMFHTSNRAPRIGPDAGVGYPSLDQFLSSLENMTMLKHLGLPADMYRITSDCVFSLAASLTGLEHLELGFDYNDLELQLAFASCFLYRARTLERITFFPLKRPEPLDAVLFHAFVASLGSSVSSTLKLFRYMPLRQVHHHAYENMDVYYHREMAVEGEWWMPLLLEEGERTFAEGRTPRTVPVGKWDWETEG